MRPVSALKDRSEEKKKRRKKEEKRAAGARTYLSG
jgi:hypothetical protein